MRRCPNVGLLLTHRLRRWPNSKPKLGQRLMFAGEGELFIMTPRVTSLSQTTCGLLQENPVCFSCTWQYIFSTWQGDSTLACMLTEPSIARVALGPVMAELWTNVAGDGPTWNKLLVLSRIWVGLICQFPRRHGKTCVTNSEISSQFSPAASFTRSTLW